VVTGKLDVREAAARLPQDVAEAALEPEALNPMDTADAEAELLGTGGVTRAQCFWQNRALALVEHV